MLLKLAELSYIVKTIMSCRHLKFDSELNIFNENKHSEILELMA